MDPVHAAALAKGAKLPDVAAFTKLTQYERHIILAEAKHCKGGACSLIRVETQRATTRSRPASRALTFKMQGYKPASASAAFSL